MPCGTYVWLSQTKICPELDAKQATAHAEFDAMAQLLPPKSGNSDSPSHREVFSFADVTLYVTVEPCLMCASALRQAGIGKIVFGCANDRFGGCGGVQRVHDE